MGVCELVKELLRLIEAATSYDKLSADKHFNVKVTSWRGVAIGGGGELL